MLKITKPAENRVDIEFSGTLNADAMRAALDDLFAKSEGVSNGRMLSRVTDFSMPSLGAIGVELQQLPKLLGLLNRFDRCAVLSDESWLRKASEIEGKLFPGMEIKSFELDNAEEAESWLAAK